MTWKIESVNTILQKLGCSAAEFSRISFADCGLRPWTMQRLLRNETVSDDGIDRVLEVAKELESLQAGFTFPLPWNDAAKIRQLLVQSRELADQQAYLEKKRQREQEVQQIATQ